MAHSFWSLACTCILAVAASCASSVTVPDGAIPPAKPGEGVYVGFEPIDPLLVEYITVSQPDGSSVQRPWGSTPDLVREMLPNQSSSTTVRRIEADGKLTYLTAAVTAKGAVYEVIMDYAKYRVEAVYSEHANGHAGRGSPPTGYGKIGVGVRIRANIRSYEAGADINGLMAISAAASVKAIAGNLSVDVYGIDSKGVNSLLPVGVKLDESSLQNALQQLATIQTRIYDDDVRLTPHLLAIRRTTPVSGPVDESKDTSRAEVMHALTVNSPGSLNAVFASKTAQDSFSAGKEVVLPYNTGAKEGRVTLQVVNNFPEAKRVRVLLHGPEIAGFQVLGAPQERLNDRTVEILAGGTAEITIVRQGEIPLGKSATANLVFGLEESVHDDGTASGPYGTYNHAVLVVKP